MHDQHRERMRTRYLQGGFDSFATHELLEMVLYYSIPRGDTNEIAHLLIERFGSLDRILEASADELQQVAGVGLKSAILLKLIPELARRYAIERHRVGVVFDSVGKLGQFFCDQYIGEADECLYMMLLDNGMRMIDCTKISKGCVNSSPAPIRVIMETAFNKKAAAVVLAHNHPHGLAVPSANDLELTDLLNSTLDAMGITLVEHIIVANDRFCPVMQQHCGTFRCSPISKKIESGFYENFYDVDPETWRAASIFEEKA